MGHDNITLFDYGAFNTMRWVDYELNGLNGYDDYVYLFEDTIGGFYQVTPDTDTSVYPASFIASTTNEFDYDFIATGSGEDPVLGSYYYDDYYVFNRFDQSSETDVNHGDWALVALLQELDDPDRTAIIAIDLDTLSGAKSHYSKLFADSTYYLPGFGNITTTTGEAIMSSWMQVNDHRLTGNVDQSDYSLAALSISIAGSPASTELATLTLLEQLNVPIVQAAPNVTQGFYDWGSNYPDVINVGAWNVDENGNLLISSDATFATPRVSAEIANLLNDFIADMETQGVSLGELQQESSEVNINYSDLVGYFIDAIGTEVSFDIVESEQTSQVTRHVLSADLELSLDPVEFEIAVSDEIAWGTIDGIEIV